MFHVSGILDRLKWARVSVIGSTCGTWHVDVSDQGHTHWDIRARVVLGQLLGPAGTVCQLDNTIALVIKQLFDKKIRVQANSLSGH
jgi:hypothetical protein